MLRPDPDLQDTSPLHPRHRDGLDYLMLLTLSVRVVSSPASCWGTLSDRPD